MDALRSWVETFTTAGIRLVFFFDGVVQEQKRAEWVSGSGSSHSSVKSHF